MKVLILSCNTGEGHNSAANAMAEAFAGNNVEYEIADPIGFGSNRAKKIVAASYNNMIKKIPGAFSAIYKAGSWYSDKGFVSPIYLANSIYAKNLGMYIEQNKFDAVLCTHLFAMEAMTALRKKNALSVPCYGVMTDYACVPFFDETVLDGYFIPHRDILKEFTDKGIPEEKIHCTGIPVSGKFSNHTDKEQARKYLVIPENKKVFLVMTGGVGCGNAAEICDELLKVQDDFIAYILSGRNSGMKDEIDKRYHDNPKIQAITFTERVNLYMNAADVLISKAGGLSSTEAAVANIPFVHLLTYSACEENNVSFFESHGMSVRAKNEREAASAAWALIKDEKKAGDMIAAQQKTINSHAAQDIARLVTSL